MNLHICYDEKVIGRTIQYFEEALPKQNIFVVMKPDKRRQYNYVKVNSPNVFYEQYDTNGFWNAIGDIREYKNIIIHFLGNESCKFLLSIPKKSPVTWIIWGADLYNELLVKRGYELYANPEDEWAVSPVNKIKKILLFPFIFLIRLHSYHVRVKAIQRISSVCGTKGDLQLLYKYFPELKPYQQKSFLYYPVDEIIGDTLMKTSSAGNNIIVGNSASPSNNHRYVFEKLKKLNLGSRKVIVPLSYGINKEVALKAGKELGKNFYPLLDFVPLDEYNKILASANTFIYGNFRQEAVGNIVIAFYLGATVFLSERSPLLSDLKELGYVLFGLSELSNRIDYVLTSEERNHNRNLVLKLNSRELMLSYIKESFG